MSPSTIEPIKWAKPKPKWVRRYGKLDTPCWVWQGATNSRGYPSRQVIGENRTELVHRAMLAEHMGEPLPDGAQVHHLCGRKVCVNPEHLRAVTRREHQEIHWAEARAKREAARERMESDGRGLDTCEI